MRGECGYKTQIIARKSFPIKLRIIGKRMKCCHQRNIFSSNTPTPDWWAENWWLFTFWQTQYQRRAHPLHLDTRLVMCADCWGNEVSSIVTHITIGNNKHPPSSWIIDLKYIFKQVLGVLMVERRYCQRLFTETNKEPRPPPHPPPHPPPTSQQLIKQKQRDCEN